MQLNLIDMRYILIALFILVSACSSGESPVEENITNAVNELNTGSNFAKAVSKSNRDKNFTAAKLLTIQNEVNVTSNLIKQSFDQRIGTEGGESYIGLTTSEAYQKFNSNLIDTLIRRVEIEKIELSNIENISEIETLRNQLKVLNNGIYVSEYSKLLSKREKVWDIFNNGDQILVGYSGLATTINAIQLTTELGSIQNPTNESMGFKFTDKIIEIAHENIDSLPENTIDQGLKAAQKGFISRIVSSELTQNILKTTPVGAVVNSFLNSFKTRSTINFIPDEDESNPNDTNTRTLGPLKKALEGGKDFITDQFISSLEEDLEGFVKFYEDSRLATEKFQINIKNLEDAISANKIDYLTFYDSLMIMLEIQDLTPNERASEIVELVGVGTNDQLGASEITFLATQKVIQMSSKNKVNSVVNMYDKFTFLIYQKELHDSKLQELLLEYSDEMERIILRFKEDETIEKDTKMIKKIDDQLAKIQSIRNDIG